MGFVGDDMVCCNAMNGQYMIPSFDEGSERHYLCGKRPYIDHVTIKIPH